MRIVFTARSHLRVVIAIVQPNLQPSCLATSNRPRHDETSATSRRIMRAMSARASTPSAHVVRHRRFRARRARPRSASGKLIDETWVELSDASFAIESGRELFASRAYADALREFERALTLPGSGTKRDRAKPAELSLGERQAALYNAAACRCAMQDVDGALVALEGCFKAGYANPRSYGASRAMRDLDAMWDDDELKSATRTEGFRELVKKYKVTPNALALQFDVGNSMIGRVIEGVNDKVTPKK